MGCTRLGTAEDKAAVEKQVHLAEAKCAAPDCTGSEVERAFERGGMPAVRALQAEKEYEARARYAQLNESLSSSYVTSTTSYSPYSQDSYSGSTSSTNSYEPSSSYSNSSSLNSSSNSTSDSYSSPTKSTSSYYSSPSGSTSSYSAPSSTPEPTSTPASSSSVHQSESLTKNSYDPMMRDVKVGEWIKLNDQAIGMRSPEDVVHIRSVVGEAVKRGGFENLLLPGVKVDLPGMQRAHSHGPGTGQEVAAGILYAPAVVNQILQNQHIERHIREVRDRADGHCHVVLTTETEAKPGTLELARITYRIALHDLDTDPLHSTPRRIQEAEIRIEGTAEKPRISFDKWQSVSR